MADAPTLLCLRGRLTVIGKSPDGDSIRFVPDTPELLGALRRGFRVRRSTEDGSVQLRLDGVDAPETHYGALAQPQGTPARDELLAACGFRAVRFGGDAVVSAVPPRVPAAVLSELSDPYGRPVSLLVAGEGAALPPDGRHVEVTRELLEGTVNARLLRRSRGYPSLYDSTPAPIRRRWVALAAAARAGGGGIWTADRSASFRLRDQDDIGPGGQLVLPKLFRRASDYLRERRAGETLPEWLRRARPDGEPVDDLALVAGLGPRRLSDLITQRGAVVEFEPDLLEVVFVER